MKKENNKTINKKKNKYKIYFKHVAGISKSNINFFGQATIIKSFATKFEASPYLYLITLAILS